MNDEKQNLHRRVEELEQENKRLTNILKEHGLIEETNEDFPLHYIWLEEGKFVGI